MIEKEEIKNRLIKKYNYPDEGAELVASKLLGLDEKLVTEFVKWWETDQLPMIEIEGYSIEKFISEYDSTPPAAFLNMNWLIKNPEEAKKAFSKGYDNVIVKKNE
ncbi:MAG: hypothetical protein WCW17_00270 [Patescibacteria group bacterium]|jgi:hypothetical protein